MTVLFFKTIFKGALRTILCLTVLISFVPLSGCDPSLEDVSSMTDQKKLVEIVLDKGLKDKVRLAAVDRINDQEALIALARNQDLWDELRAQALVRIEDQRIIVELVKTAGSLSVIYRRGLFHLDDPDVLLDLVLRPNSKEIRQVAAAKVRDQAAIRRIIQEVVDDDVARRVVSHIEDLDTLILAAQSGLPLTSSDAQKQLYDILEEKQDDRLLARLVSDSFYGTSFGRKLLAELDDHRVLLEIYNAELKRRSSPDEDLWLGPHKLCEFVNESPDFDEVCYVVANAAGDEIIKCALERLERNFDQIQNEEVLTSILTSTLDQDLAQRALAGIKKPELLLKAMLGLYLHENINILQVKLIVDQMDDVNDLLTLVNHAHSSIIRRHALDNIEDERLLKDVVTNNYNGASIRNTALARIRDREFWVETAYNNSYPEVQKQALVMWLTDGRQARVKNAFGWDDQVNEAQTRMILEDPVLVAHTGKLRLSYKTDHLFLGWESWDGNKPTPVWNYRATVKIKNGKGTLLSDREYFSLRNHGIKVFDPLEISSDLLRHVDEAALEELAKAANPFLRQAAREKMADSD